ncbi:MAG: addiction module antidote protein, HigA family [Pseudomonadales bacterium RIFCSPLOWO2_12_59_9]|nr:MAG: addiction module antidote protein, HigA family [Pseudomonadales bacterium RIFCSPLOWO2_12_59_9]
MANDVSAPVHPGEILQLEFLKALGITPVELASALKVSPAAVRGLVGRRRKISADMALRLGRYFNTSARFWMNLQAEYSLAVSFAACGEEIERQVTPL